MMAFAMDNPAQSTLVVIGGDRDFAYAAAILRQRRYDIVVIAPPNNPLPHSLKSQASFCLDWNRDVMVQKKNDIDRASQDASGDATSSPNSEIDLSSLHTHKKGEYRSAGDPIDISSGSGRHETKLAVSGNRASLDGSDHSQQPTRQATGIPHPSDSPSTDVGYQLQDFFPGQGDGKDLGTHATIMARPSKWLQHIPQTLLDIRPSNSNEPLHSQAAQLLAAPADSAVARVPFASSKSFVSSNFQTQSIALPQVGDGSSYGQPAINNNASAPTLGSLSLIRHVQSSGDSTIDRKFLPLVHVLERLRQQGCARPQCSQVGIELHQYCPGAIQRSGVAKFRQYVTLAEESGIVSVNDWVPGPDSWMSLLK